MIKYITLCSLFIMYWQLKSIDNRIGLGMLKLAFQPPTVPNLQWKSDGYSLFIATAV